MEYLAIIGAVIVLVAIFYNPDKKRYGVNRIWWSRYWAVKDTRYGTTVAVFETKSGAKECADILNEG